MGNTLRLTRAKSFKKINKLGKQLFTKAGLRFTKRNDVSIATAGTYSNAAGYATRVAIGVKNLKYASDGESHLSKRDVEVSDDVFARIVLNMYHEKSHCHQKNELFKQSHFNSQEECNQLLQEIDCRASDDYYDGCGNYQLNAGEIRAERDGIVGAYKYLRKEFPNIDEKEHECIILDIVNDKMRKSSYFVKQAELFTSLQEVLDAFDDAYDKSFTEKRIFKMEKKPKDPVKAFMNEHEDAMEMYFKAPTAVEQDRCIAAIALELHPEWLEQYPALKDMDLSYENVIAKPYREIKEREERELYAKEEEMDGIVKGKVNVESVKVPVKKHYDEKDLKGLSRAEQLDMMFGHLMKDENREDEPEK